MAGNLCGAAGFYSLQDGYAYKCVYSHVMIAAVCMLSTRPFLGYFHYVSPQLTVSRRFYQTLMSTKPETQECDWTLIVLLSVNSGADGLNSAMLRFTKNLARYGVVSLELCSQNRVVEGRPTLNIEAMAKNSHSNNLL